MTPVQNDLDTNPRKPRGCCWEFKSRVGALGRRAWAETLPRESPLATLATPDLSRTHAQGPALHFQPLARSRWSVLSPKHARLPREPQDGALGHPENDSEGLLLVSFYEAPITSSPPCEGRGSFC